VKPETLEGGIPGRRDFRPIHIRYGYNPPFDVLSSRAFLCGVDSIAGYVKIPNCRRPPRREDGSRQKPVWHSVETGLAFCASAEAVPSRRNSRHLAENIPLTSGVLSQHASSRHSGAASGVKLMLIKHGAVHFQIVQVLCA
jgi:hypothetical protein